MATEPSDEEIFPTLHLDWKGKYDLPESGTMTIRFKKTSETNSKHKGEERQMVALDVLEILDTRGSKSNDKPKDEDTGAALDKLKEEVESEEPDNDDNY